LGAFGSLLQLYFLEVMMDTEDLIPLQARRANKKDAKAICATLVDAFFDDPVWSWAFDNLEQRRTQYLAWFGIAVDQGLDYQTVWATTGLEAVAVWVPPGQPELNADRASQLEELLRELCGSQADLIFEIFAILEKNVPEEPMHYLSLLATATQHRGRRFGMNLLQSRLAELDRLDEPAYLESSNPANHRRYQRVGFEPVRLLSLPHRGPEILTMWREPQN
jgi:GNAT superfamily N-acetyltransferase